VKINQDALEIDDSLARVDFDKVHGWLAGTYWSPGVGKEEVIQGAKNSTLVVGAYQGGAQAGYLRVISDKIRFAYILDVIVAEELRGGGIGREMVKFAVDHPDFAAVYQWVLATRDAHGVYAPLGFGPAPEPDRWMILLKPKEW
jgi:GNAT superfamily N-acetyltransferase